MRPWTAAPGFQFKGSTFRLCSRARSPTTMRSSAHCHSKVRFSLVDWGAHQIDGQLDRLFYARP
jgi:hypothetical protein